MCEKHKNKKVNYTYLKKKANSKSYYILDIEILSKYVPLY